MRLRGGYQTTFRLKKHCKWHSFEYNVNVGASGRLYDTTRVVWRQVTSIVLDLAVTLFTPRTPNVLCRLKHFTHPSISGWIIRFRWPIPSSSFFSLLSHQLKKIFYCWLPCDLLPFFVSLEIKMVEVIKKIAQQWRTMSPEQKRVLSLVELKTVLYFVFPHNIAFRRAVAVSKNQVWIYLTRRTIQFESSQVDSSLLDH